MATRKRAERRRGQQAAAGGGREGLSLDRDAVRRLRLQRGLTQQALAQQRVQLDGQSMQLSYAQIRRIEQDGRAGPASARILAALLGVELAQLRPRDARGAPCGLPREPSVDFVGRRAAVEAVLQILAREGSARVAASVEGLPGIGKTELALQVCAECERSGSYRVFWFDAQGGDLRSAWSDIVAPHLGIENPDPEQRAKLALRAVEALGDPTLVVLDNLEHWSSSQPWPRPQGRHIRWLVTTRISQLGERAFEHVELPVLDAQSARELMLRIAGLAVTRQPGFDALLAHLDGYTIALELAAAFLGRFPEVGPDEYLKVLLEGKRDVLETEVKDRTSYQETLDRALELLWHRIPPSVRDAWLLAARFEQERASHALSDACGLGRKLRAQLRDFHLIQVNAQGWTMHRLTRAFGRRAGGPEQQQHARERFLRGCCERAEAIELDDSFRIYAPDRPHFDAALAAAEDGALESDAARRFRNTVVTALHSLGDYATAKEIRERSLRAALRSFGEDHREVAAARGELAIAWWFLGQEPRARELLEQALDQLLRHLGEDHPDIANHRSNLALVLRSLGELPRARQLAESAFESALRDPGRDPTRLTEIRTNLGLVLKDLGELHKARELLERSLEDGLQRFGEDHPSVARERSSLAWILTDLGELRAARHLLEQAVESQVRRFGEDHPMVAEYRDNLAMVLRDLGELREARELCERALGSDLRNYDEDSSRVAQRRNKLAAVLHDLGELLRARDLLEQVISSRL
jgi:tetratricopeptide (TPR) repeat protein/transcriptional regulator with XRE-family HTH domain